MSITDELREWLRSLYTPNGGTLKRDGERIADRIDAEHVAALKSLGMAQAERDEYLESCRLWEFKCDSMVELPRDADGEPIKFGDEVEWRRTCSEDYSVTEHGTVDGVEIYQVNGETIAHVTINRNGYNNRMPPSALRHRHEPTVEDVLEELLREYDRDDSELTNGEIVERFAARLRLAGDAE